MRRTILAFAALLVALPALQHRPLAAPAGKRLQIYFVDVEGGAATLIVTPAGESVLVDCGWPGEGDRDPKRIQRAAQFAGVSSVDHLVSTHWHTDHYGGVAGLSRLLPIRHFYNRGIPDRLDEDPEHFPQLIAAYKEASGGHSTTLHPGDTLPLRPSPSGAAALTIACLAANREVIGGGKDEPNPECSHAETRPYDSSDNARSIALLMRFGDFRFLDCGDLTWNIEEKLVCPSDKIGKIDLFQVTHHGADLSNNPVLVHSIHPRVAVIDNGPRKGGERGTYATLHSTPGIETIFQLHRNLATTETDNTAPELTANMEEQCEGRFVKAEVTPDGRRYTVAIEGRAARRYGTR